MWCSNFLVVGKNQCCLWFVHVTSNSLAVSMILFPIKKCLATVKSSSSKLALNNLSSPSTSSQRWKTEKMFSWLWATFHVGCCPCYNDQIYIICCREKYKGKRSWSQMYWFYLWFKDNGLVVLSEAAVAVLAVIVVGTTPAGLPSTITADFDVASY